MSDDEQNETRDGRPQAPIPFKPPRRRRGRGRGGRRTKPKLRKLRLLSVLVGFSFLALISTLFGMMMAVASDLPQIENRAQYGREVNSYLYDDHWRPIGIFAPPTHDVIDTYGQIAQSMKDAIVSVEDRRFWSDPGVDIRGLGRAFIADLTGKPTQGASTIAEQFVKNALAEQGNRTIFEKLREAVMAYHLTQEWHRWQILTQYLNTIYFGNGAYGVESAARVYFGQELGYDPNAPASPSSACGDAPRPACASVLAPYQAALLAGMVANPSAFNPVEFPVAAAARRNLVLLDMRQQGDISRLQYEQGIVKPVPRTVEQPQEPAAAPYFTSWLRPQILDAMGGRGVSQQVAEYRAYYGGLKIRTTIDLPMQQAALQAISNELPSGPNEPVASLVAIDNQTGQVRAMVGGPLVNGQQDYSQYPFNIATAGERQPGSAFKPFTLAVALQHGFTPYSVIDSHPLNLIVPNSGGREHYAVRNFGNQYSGPISLAAATAVSDNSVFTQVGLAVGTKRIARMANAMGIRTPVSTNYAMIIGGLKIGVSPLDMAHAYETIAEGGRRVYDPVLGAPDEGPTGIAQIQCPVISCNGKRALVDHPHYRRVMPVSVAQTIHSLLTGVVANGTGTAAAISGVDVAGKTGTTSNYGDAWFVGWTPQITTAVWVGFPNRLVPMTTLFNGNPVEGGTFPALIWRSFTVQALQIEATEKAEFGPHPRRVSSSSSSQSGTGTTPSGSTVQSSTSTSTTAPAGGGTGTTGGQPAGTNQGTGTTPAPQGTGTTPAGGATSTGSSGGAGLGSG